jgi:rhamnogalacturonyl hydrolase YesR
MDYFIQEDGSIKVSTDEYNIDNINNEKCYLSSQRNRREKYKKAAELLRSQLKTHLEHEGAFWHKQIYHIKF